MRDSGFGIRMQMLGDAGHLFFQFLYELHRGAVVVCAGELAEADVGDA